MIRATDIHFSYSKSRPFVLQCPNIEAKPKEVTCIVGPNGSGKSTLLGILGGRIRCSQGTVLYKNQDIRSLPRDNLAKEIGWIDSNAVSSLVSEMLVIDHLALALLAGRQTIPLFHRTLRVENLIENTRMPEQLAKQMVQLATQRIADLNSGARQAVMIALALINPRDVILADEGTATLDIRNARQFFKIMRKLTELKDVAIIAVTHDLMLAAKFSDSIYYVRDGCVKEFEMKDGSDVDTRIHALENLFPDE